MRRQTKIGQALKGVAAEVAATGIADNQKELLALAKLAPTERNAVARGRLAHA